MAQAEGETSASPGESRDDAPAVEARHPGVRTHAVVLAAGRSSRMGGTNKLLADFGRRPLVRLIAERVLASKAASCIVVTGYQRDLIREALAGLETAVVENPDFAQGLSTSLKAGIAALPETADGALVVLADMPGVTAADLDRLLAAFAASQGRAVIRATHAGRRGNPVILPKSLFAALAGLEGDMGARALIERSGTRVIDVEIGEAATRDIDTAGALKQAGGVARTEKSPRRAW